MTIYWSEFNECSQFPRLPPYKSASRPDMVMVKKERERRDKFQQSCRNKGTKWTSGTLYA
ncbi:hypothetical protein K443DRAFT_544416 [Laccaria amethystina LaAM-08-1]|uniref:Uncharacterized protein n=1 Tax=Laccaria amethystina LaAM-08-1 TaxID=1095629 RepID=A0A0C9WH26_9AGAR|nr:hypothetical protein K443DRAFT_544416 [Laccaria amethystina LaAM-08-1]